ncbi:hypothetical protein S7711_04659 [Stachybotrys chartarum IBT 7711]|uniref:NmrA-like family domain-containing protein 1 n=1 Tax=Stachybotrys chartarum (strain CBS 109288 / IBT 7711) TaxID=1280523 RepID=A0A084B616_STACB|nr:hypothetical protein S7711_04659 [Stachybotrys chartarum IBT 7711]
MSKLITVFGATGQQGGSVVEAILADPALSKEFRIRAVTRDTSKPNAKALAARGVELVTADMSTPESVAPAVRGAHTVFLVTNFWESVSAAVEAAQGKAVADAAKAEGVQHLVFSSLLNIRELSGGRLTHVSHFDAKADVEQYIRDIGVPATFVLAGLYMSNFFDVIRRSEDGGYLLAWPVDGDKAQMPVYDPLDTGKYVKAAIKNFPEWKGRRIYGGANYMTPKELVKQFSDVLGKPATYQQIPQDVFKTFLPDMIAQEMLENLLLLEGPGYYGGQDLAESLALLDEKPTTWSEYVEKNKEKYLSK